MTQKTRSIHIIIAFWLMLLPLASFALAQSSQQQKNPPQTPQDQPIRVRTDLIELRAVVTNKQGQPITDLKQEDFELLENNKSQEISFFSIVKIPSRSAAGEARRVESAPSTVNPAASNVAEMPSRTVVLYVDTLHLSTQNLLRVKQQMRKFIDEKLSDQDLTAIVTSIGSLGVVEQFTRDRRVLRSAVDRLSPWPSANNSLFSPYIAAMVDRGDREAISVARSIYAAEEHIPPNDPTLTQLVQMRARQIVSETTYMRRAALLTLRAVTERLGSLPGQRLIVLISDGFTLLDQSGSMDTTDLQSVTSRAVRSGVVIYSVDAKGLQPPPLFDASLGNVPNDPRIHSYISAGERDLENGLNALARDTGGEPFFNTNDTAGAMGRALDNNQVYYAVAYYPAGEESDKKFRKITIKIKGHPEYLVRAQRGYLPAELAKKAKENEAKTPNQRFMDAILAPLPMTTISVMAKADYIEGTDDSSQVSMFIDIDGKTITYREENGRYRSDVEVVMMVFNSDGKRVDLISEVIKIGVPQERLEYFKQSSISYHKRISLKPGLYQIRAGVREQGEERIGTAAAWVEVPDLSKKKLIMSSLILGHEAATQQTATPSTSPQESSPKSVRVIQGITYYHIGQPILYFFRLYNAAASDAAETDAVMQIEILKEEKPISSLPWQPVKDRLYGKDAKGLVIGGLLTPTKLAPGVYDLRISIKGGKMKQPIQRSVAFGIEP